MKLLFHSLLVVSAAGLGLAVGFAWRGRPAARLADPGAVSAAVAPSKTPALASRHGGVAITDDSPLATRLEHSLAMSSGVSRWLYWLDALEKAAPGDFARLARLAQGNPAALRLIATRWVQVNPRHLYDTLISAEKNGIALPVRELADALFADWPRTNPTAAIAALNEPGDIGRRDQWRHRVATAVMDDDVESGLSIMADWHIDNYGPRMSGVAKWAAADPLHAAQFTADHATGYAAQLAMQTIGEAWAKTDPAAALSFAAAHPGELGSALATSTLQQWAGGNLTDAANWLAGTDSFTRNSLSPAFVETWAQKDATAALAWCRDNLTGSSQAQAVGAVLKGSAAKDVSAAAALVAGMDPSLARAAGAVAVAQKWFPELSSSQAVPPESVAWLASLDPASQKRVMDQVQWGWSTSDPKTMAAFLASSANDQISPSAYDVLARQLARQNPTDALAWANSLPDGRGLAAGSEAFVEWRNSQPDAATQWLNSLPADDARREPFFQNSIRAVAYHPQAAEQLAALSDSDRAAARGVIEGMTLPDYRRNQLLQVLSAH